MDPERLDALRSAAARAFETTPVVFAYLFGSQATGRAGPASDVDVAVFLAPGADSVEISLALAARLEEASALRPIEVVALNGAPLSIRGRVVSEGVPIYSADEPARVRFEVAALKESHDFEIHARDMRRSYLRNVAEGRA